MCTNLFWCVAEAPCMHHLNSMSSPVIYFQCFFPCLYPNSFLISIAVLLSLMLTTINEKKKGLWLTAFFDVLDFYN